MPNLSDRSLTRPPHQRADEETRHSARPAFIGVAAALLLIALAIAVPRLTHWQVHAQSWAPLHVTWHPRVGIGTIPAIVVGVLGVVFAATVARRVSWRILLLGAFILGVAWSTSLALVDGLEGITVIFDRSSEYLGSARQVTDVGALLHEYIARIPRDSVGHWPVHLAGHPPGAVLFFVLLVRLGLGSAAAAGWIVLVLGATTPVAVLLAVRRLGAEDAARRAAPFLVLGPAAIWMAVSADGLFAAVAAWGLCALAYAATTRHRGARAGWGILAGLLLGYAVMMSYGLPLLGILALAVLLVARTWRPLLWAAGAAAGVVLGFAAGGFAWWQAYPVLHERYYAGIASQRPYAYWVWGNLAALSVSAGPLVGGVVALVGQRLRPFRGLTAEARVIVILVVAAAATILVADLSGMSKAEVERIWLPFVPWLLLGAALLPQRWVRWALGLQVVFALVAQHLLFSQW